jgi:hypothetical protein
MRHGRYPASKVPARFPSRCAVRRRGRRHATPGIPERYRGAPRNVQCRGAGAASAGEPAQICLYGGNDHKAWSKWATAHPNARLYIHHGPSTKGHTEQLRKFGLPNVVIPPKALAAHLHCSVPRCTGSTASRRPCAPRPRTPRPARPDATRTTRAAPAACATLSAAAFRRRMPACQERGRGPRRPKTIDTTARPPDRCPRRALAR